MANNLSGGYNSEADGGQGTIGRLLARAHKTDRTLPQEPPLRFVRIQDVHLLPFDTSLLYDTVRVSVEDMIQPTQLDGIQQRQFLLDGMREMDVQQQTKDASNPRQPQKRKLSSDSDVLNENIIKAPTDTTFGKRTHVLPQDLYDVVARIKDVKTNSLGFPMRRRLHSALPIEFNANGLVRKYSKLRPYYGDTRLLTEREWRYLTTPGKGDTIE